MSEPRVYRQSLWNRAFPFVWLILMGVIMVGGVAGLLLFWWPAMVISLWVIAFGGTMIASVAEQLAHSAARVILDTNGFVIVSMVGRAAAIRWVDISRVEGFSVYAPGRLVLRGLRLLCEDGRLFILTSYLGRFDELARVILEHVYDRRGEWQPRRWERVAFWGFTRREMARNSQRFWDWAEHVFGPLD